MKKTLLLLCALLGLCGSGAWGEDVTVTFNDGENDILFGCTKSSSTLTSNAASGLAGVTFTCSFIDQYTRDKLVALKPSAARSAYKCTFTAPAGYLIKSYEISAVINSDYPYKIDTSTNYDNSTATDINSTEQYTDINHALTTSATTASFWLYLDAASLASGSWLKVKILRVVVERDPSKIFATYTVVDEDTQVLAGTAAQTLNSAPNISNAMGTNKSSALNMYASYANGYCTYEYYSDASCETSIATLTDDCTVYAKVASTSSLPITYSSSIDAIDATLYTIKINGYSIYVENNTVTKSLSNIVSDYAQWVFTGSVYNTYIYNKGAQKYLVMSDHTFALSDDPQSWIIWKHQKDGYSYLYYQSDYYFPFVDSSESLGYSYGPYNDNGTSSAVAFTEVVQEYNTSVSADIQPYFTTGVGSYFGLKSSVYDTYYSRVTAATSTCTSSEYATLLGIVEDASNFEYPATGYYRIRNYNGGYIGRTSGSTTVSNLASNDVASVIYLTRSGEEGSYTYTMKMQGESYTEQTGTFSLTVAAPGYFYMNDRTTNNLFGYHYKNGTGVTHNNLQTAGDAAKWKIEDANNFSVTLNTIEGDDNNYATLCVPMEVTMPASTAAYTISVSGSEATPSVAAAASGTLTAGTPVLLMGSASSATMTINNSVAPATSPTSVSGNDLTGTFVNTTIDGSTDYVLGTDETKVGFFHWDRNTLSANRAYIDTPAGVKGFFLNFNDIYNSIDAARQVTATDSRIYDMQGRQVAQPARGLYIVNGKKVAIQ